MNTYFPSAWADHTAAAAPAALVRPIPGQLTALLLEEIECGLIVCDDKGAVQFANHSALQELASCRLMRLAGDTVVCMAAQAAEWSAALRGAATRGKRQLVRLSVVGDRLLVSVTPFQPADGSPCWALLTLGRRKPCSELGLELLAKVYKLTFTERQVLAALVAEATPREIAAQRGVGLSTVRSQIKSTREKMGVLTIDSLLLRVAEMPPVASALRLVAGANPRHAGPVQTRPSLPMAA